MVGNKERKMDSIDPMEAVYRIFSKANEKYSRAYEYEACEKKSGVWEGRGRSFSSPSPEVEKARVS